MTSCRGPCHFNQKFAGKTSEWSGTDNQQAFESKLKDSKQLEKLTRLGWLENKIIYAYNSEGFRDVEFDQRRSILALGCSHTEGVGLLVEQTWPRQLENAIDNKVWNLGVGGAALDTCFRLLDYWLEHLNVVAVCCAVPAISRFEVNEQNNWSNILPTLTGYQTWISNWNKNYVAYEKNGEMNRYKNLLAMSHICSLRQIPFYYDLLEDFYDAGNARDLAHCGPEPNSKLATKFAQLVQGEKDAIR